MGNCTSQQNNGTSVVKEQQKVIIKSKEQPKKQQQQKAQVAEIPSSLSDRTVFNETPLTEIAAEENHTSCDTIKNEDKEEEEELNNDSFFFDRVDKTVLDYQQQQQQQQAQQEEDDNNDEMIVFVSEKQNGKKFKLVEEVPVPAPAPLASCSSFVADRIAFFEGANKNKEQQVEEKVEQVEEETFVEEVPELISTVPVVQVVEAPIKQVINNNNNNNNNKKQFLSKTSKRMEKAMKREGFSFQEDIVAVSLRTKNSSSSSSHFQVKNPEVYRYDNKKSTAPSTYIVFGEIQNIHAQRAAACATTTTNSSFVNKNNNEKFFDQEDFSTSSSSSESSDVQLIMRQTGATAFQAQQTLSKNEGDVVNAIMELTL